MTLYRVNAIYWQPIFVPCDVEAGSPEEAIAKVETEEKSKDWSWEGSEDDLDSASPTFFEVVSADGKTLDKWPEKGRAEALYALGGPKPTID